MIFVTVGTHEQPFDRLIKKIDKLKEDGKIIDDVFVQTGYSTYEPQNCKFKKFLTYKEMEKTIESSNLIISHGGPASFVSVLSKQKPLLIVPRLLEFNEHVNNHQLDFVKKMNARGYELNYVVEMSNLLEKISLNESKASFKSHNEKFNQKFKTLIMNCFNI